MKNKHYRPYYKPRVELIRHKAKEVIPRGYYCNEANIFGVECPFLQRRKMTNSRLTTLCSLVDIPQGNTQFQYCSYLKQYLRIQDCIKDCGIKEGYGYECCYEEEEGEE